MLTIALTLLGAYFGSNLLLTAICFAAALLIRRMNLGRDSVSLSAMREEAVFFTVAGSIGVLAATPLLVIAFATVCGAAILLLVVNGGIGIVDHVQRRKSSA